MTGLVYLPIWEVNLPIWSSYLPLCCIHPALLQRRVHGVKLGGGRRLKMYSIFLPFAAIVIDLCVAYIYFKVYDHQYSVYFLGRIFAANNYLKDGGITTSL